MLAGFGQILLVECNHLGPIRQFGAVEAQLLIDLAKILGGVAPIYACRINHMDQYAGSFHMAQKGVAKPDAGMGTLDQARNIGDDEAVVLAHIHQAQIGLKRREGIAGNFGAGGANHREQRGLARVGTASQPHISDKLQFQFKRESLAGFTKLGEARCLAHRGGEMDIA